MPSAGRRAPTTNIGIAYSWQHRYPEAIESWRRALAVHEAHGHLAETGMVLDNLAQVYRHQGMIEGSFDCATRAIAIWRKLEDPRGQGIATYALAKTHASAGDHDAAIDAFGEAIRLFRQTSERFHEAETLDFLGDVHLGLGNTTAADLGAARAYLDDSQVLRDKRPDTYEQGRLDQCRGDLARRLGDLDEAQRHWRRALACYEQVQVREADGVRRSLAEAAAAG